MDKALALLKIYDNRASDKYENGKKLTAKLSYTKPDQVKVEKNLDS